jgi:hypothetical protein
MRQGRVVVVLPAILVALGLSAQASAGPPASCFRGKTRCDLTYYEAAQTFIGVVREKLLAAGFTAVRAGAFGCGPTARHSLGFARCDAKAEGGGLAAPCTFEALLSRRRGVPFKVVWWKESPSCSG